MPWYLGARVSKAENVRCLREGVFSLLSFADQDLRARLPVGTGAPQCQQAMANRIDRLRALGNAVVPQVAEFIGRRIMALETTELLKRKA